MASQQINVEQIANRHYRNVARGIHELVEHSEGSHSKNDDSAALEEVKEKLKQDMRRLMTSPSTQIRLQPGLILNRNAVETLRSLWAVTKEMEQATPAEASSKLAKLNAAVKRAVTAMDPEQVFGKDDLETNALRNAHRGGRWASKLLKRYDKQKEDDDLAAFMADGYEDEEEEAPGV